MISSSRSQSGLVLAAMWAASCFAAAPQTQQQSPRKSANQASTRGKQTFSSTCATCHGLDGRGAERGPNIAENPKVQRLSDAQIVHIIHNGVPGTGMPAFHTLEPGDVKAVVTYLRTLQGTKQTVKLPGDPGRGATIFFGKAGCSHCHMIAGKGGFIASDLSSYARAHVVDQIRSAITTPASASDRQARLVTATIHGGEKVVGRIRNEDNFSLQLQTLDGTFDFITKSDLASLEYNSQPLMPSDYGSTLTPDELNDVISYLMKAANVSGSGTLKKADEWEE
ncbi:MAG: c-type cytochrome [Candidatus Sulfotelmatobacter sp.]